MFFSLYRIAEGKGQQHLSTLVSPSFVTIGLKEKKKNETRWTRYVNESVAQYSWFCACVRAWGTKKEYRQRSKMNKKKINLFVKYYCGRRGARGSIKRRRGILSVCVNLRLHLSHHRLRRELWFKSSPCTATHHKASVWWLLSMNSDASVVNAEDGKRVSVLRVMIWKCCFSCLSFIYLFI